MASVQEQKNRNSTTYRVFWRQDGRQRTVSGFLDRPSAERFKSYVETYGPDEAIRMYELEEAGARVQTVSEWLTEHVDSLTGVQPATANRYRRYIANDLHGLADMPITAVTEKSISRWVHQIESQTDAQGNTISVAGKTLQNKHAFLSGAFRAAVRAGIIDSNPCEGRRLTTTLGKDMVFLTPAEFQMMRDCITQPRYRDLAVFLVTTGLRFSEATALTADDIDVSAMTCRVNKAWKYSGNYHPKIGPPKSRKSNRTITISPTALATLDLDQPECLFTNGAGNPVRAQEFYNLAWKPARERAIALGLKKSPRVHDLRHTHASWLINAGEALPVVQARLGHENISTTISRYYHLDQRAERRAAQTIELLMNSTPKEIDARGSAG